MSRSSAIIFVCTSLFSLIAFSHVFFAQQADTISKEETNSFFNSYEYRRVDSSLLSELRSGGRYSYDIRGPKESMTFREWLFAKIRQMFGEGSDLTFAQILNRVLISLLIMGAIVAIIVFVVKSKRDPNIMRSDKMLERSDLIPDAAEASLDELRAQYEVEQDWNKALRVVYLQTLDLLDSANVIRTEAYKTNKQYLAEVGQEEYRSGFSEIIRLFEYDWYGGFDINPEQYSHACQMLASITSVLANKKKNTYEPV